MRCEAEVRRMLSQALRVPPQLIEAEASAQWRLRQQQTAVVQRAARSGARDVHSRRAETAAPFEGGVRVIVVITQTLGAPDLIRLCLLTPQLALASFSPALEERWRMRCCSSP